MSKRLDKAKKKLAVRVRLYEESMKSLSTTRAGGYRKPGGLKCRNR